MKILHITNAYPTPEIPAYGIFIKEQVDSLRSVGLNVDVHLINGREKGWGEYLRAARCVRRLVSEYDIVHCHHILTSIPVLSARPDVPVVVSYMNNRANQIQKLPRSLSDLVVGWSERKADARIYKDEVPDEWGGDPLSFRIPNGVDTAFFSPASKRDAKIRLGLDPNQNYALFVSFYDLMRPQKRYDLYKETLAMVNAQSGRDLQELHLVSESRDRVPDYFNASDVLLVTSDYEGSPNAVKEAMSCNLAVVSRDVGDVRTLLGGLLGARVIDSSDPRILAEHCVELLDQEVTDLRAAVDERGLSMQSIADRLLSVYTKLNA